MVASGAVFNVSDDFHRFEIDDHRRDAQRREEGAQAGLRYGGGGGVGQGVEIHRVGGGQGGVQMVDVRWKPADNVTVYLRGSKGFKSGGFNGRANNPG
jgi:hypothetical protein